MHMRYEGNRKDTHLCIMKCEGSIFFSLSPPWRHSEFVGTLHQKINLEAMRSLVAAVDGEDEEQEEGVDQKHRSQEHWVREAHPQQTPCRLSYCLLSQRCRPNHNRWSH